MNKKALVVMSGGQDSTTCLIWALNNYVDVSVITFFYKQRHEVEIKSVVKIIDKVSEDYGRKISHIVMEIPLAFISSAMIKEETLSDEEFFYNNIIPETMEVDKSNNNVIGINKDSGLPTTFVPGRNLIFILIASSYAYQNNIDNVITGVCQTDYSGYPDCRDSTIKSLQSTIRLGLDRDIIIHTPLMFLTKAETIELMDRYGGYDYYKYTHTCYEGKRPACGLCPACLLRLKGFYESGNIDPLDYEVRPTLEEIEQFLEELNHEEYQVKKKILRKEFDRK